MMRITMVASAVVLVCAGAAAAQDTAELLNRMKAMEARIQALEAEVQSLKGQTAQAPRAAPPQTTPPPPAVAQTAPVTPPAGAPQTQLPQPEAMAPQGQVQLGGAGPAAAKVLNPDISVIGDFVGGIGNPGNRYTPSLEMHESEVGFQAIIDPYARGDFFLTFGEEGVGLEEGYLPFTSLPGALQLKVGKMRAAFGKVNTMHNHTMPWTDRPLVTQNLAGGEDGIDDAGLSLSRILPSPKGLFLEGTAQVYRGDTANVFHADKRRDLATVGHLRAYRDITESTNLDLGGSFARGRSPFGDGWNQLYGFDATLRWKPLRRSIYRSFVGRTELVWARTVVGPVVSSPELDSAPRALLTPFGFYASGEYQLARRWFLGGRFDRSQRGACLPTEPATTSDYCAQLPLKSLLRDTGGSLLLTYWPSEFSQVRGQLRRTRYGEGLTANEILFQFIFSLGAHGAHPF